MTESKLRWEDPAWRTSAEEWIASQATKHRITISGPVEQPHMYAWSTVLRVPTNDGTLFFKATAPETIYEAALTKKLAEWNPERLPDFLAVDPSRGWMLMRDGGEQLRASIRPTKNLKPWYPVIKMFSELQLKAADHIDELLAFGVPDWRLARLPGLYEQLLTDKDAIRVDQPKGLTSEEFNLTQSMVPRFAQICEELAAFGIPETVNHGDFHDGNVLVKDGRITLFDWGDGNISHPFVSLRTFFVSIEISLELEDYSFTPEMQALLDVYLEPWSKFGSKEKLMQAYSLSRCVASIVKALGWHQTVSPLKGELREEYAHIVPELFREFVEYEKRLNS